MILIAITLSFTIFINVGLGILVFAKKPTFRRVNFVFSLLSWAVAGWTLSVLMAYLFNDSSWRIFWGRTSFATSGAIPTAFLWFTVLFPREQRRLSSVRLFLMGLPSIVFLLLSYTNLIVSSLHAGLPVFNYGPAYPLFSIYFVSYMFLAFFFLMRTYGRSMGIERLQIKYCLIGTVSSTSLGAIMNLFLPIVGISKFNWLGPPFTMLLVGFTAYAIVKHRLMDINIVFKKGTTYALLILLLFVPSFLLALLFQKVVYGDIHYLLLGFLSLLLLLVTFVFNRIKPQTERAVEQFLFKSRYNYRETLARFSKAMVTILDLQSLAKSVFETITQTMGVDKASLFLWNEEKGAYSLFESKNVNVTTTNPQLPKDDPLPRYLQKMGEVIIREELAKGGNIPELKYIVNMMSLIGAEASIPLISKGQLIGMLNLGYKFNKDIYSHEDIELLSTLANQTAIAIENAKLYEDLKKSKSYIRRADRLASLGTLTAGLAHEIRNPLVAIKTLTQLLPERLEDEEFREQFLKIAVRRGRSDCYIS